MTADPYKANGGGAGDSGDRGSWNRYGYVGGDPVNFVDQRGLLKSEIHVGVDIGVNSFFDYDFGDYQGTLGLAAEAGGEQAGGGGGGSPDSFFKRLNDTLHQQAADALRSLGQRCKNALDGKGIDRSKIALTASTTVYLVTYQFGKVQVRKLTRY